MLLILFASPAAPEIKVPVWVKDSEATSDAPVARFEARLGDQPAAVTAVDSPEDSLILLVVIDLVGDLIRVDAARQALVGAIEKLGDQQYVALLEARDGLRVVQDPSVDRAALEKAVVDLPVASHPGLLDSLEEAAEIAHSMLERSQVRVAVLAITDGSIYDYRGDYTSPVINPSDGSDLSRRFRDRLIREKIAAIQKSLSGSWAPLFFLHLEERTDSLNQVYQNGLVQFAEDTSGQAIFCRSVAEIPAQLDELMKQILSLYTVTIQAPADLEGQNTRLHLEATPAKELRYRERVELPSAKKAE